ncbi:hypothetical protein ACIRYZ_32420 [Kitasatospora sp. NPDC101155]|jgi:hypothetical protein|uniref:hypothetical protein n=1 Tax=Kitasatospora sp. NPDC101155 TaxID=3364097 RepID=UPI0037F24E6E
MTRHHQRLVALTGSLALPYIALKTYWAAGGRAGMTDSFDMADEFRRNGGPAALIWLERHGVDFTAALALTGVALALLLAHRPPARPLPRRLLLVPAWAGTLLIPYGLLTALLGALGSGSGNAPLTGWVIPAGAAAFVGIGTALALSAWPHRFSRRTATAR